MNAIPNFSSKGLRLQFLTCLLGGAAISSSLSGQDAPVQVEQSPKWATPVPVSTAQLPVPNFKRVPHVTAPTLGLFEVPKSKSEVTSTQLSGEQHSNAPTTKVVSSQAESLSLGQEESHRFPSIAVPELAEPLPLSRSHHAGQSISTRKILPVIQDRFVTPTGNTEPGLLDPNLPVSDPFPKEGALRMSPPETSVFDNPSEQQSKPLPNPAAFPADDLQIPPINSDPSTEIPDLSVPAPFNIPAEMPRTATSPLPVEQSFPTVSQSPQATYNPPAQVPVARPTQATVAVQENVHEVQPGENYWTISRQHFGTARFFAALAEYNKHRIPRPDRMKPGMFVLVPTAELLEQRYPKMAGIIDAHPTPESLLESGYFVGENNQPFYRIGKGDTLTEIAENHLGRTARWTQIVGMNQDILKDGNTLKIGMVLRLPHDASQVSLAPPVE